MSTAVYNALEQAESVPGKVVPVTTYEQAVQTWRSGEAEGVLVPETMAAPSVGRRSAPLFKRYLVLLTPRVTTNLQVVLKNSTLVASPEERDCLAKVLSANKIGAKATKDIRLLTQEQYLANSECVDVYCTSVVTRSAFLSKLSYPFFVSGIKLPGLGVDSYDPQYYTKCLNLDAFETSFYNVRRFT
jgi:hypothetical protein